MARAQVADPIGDLLAQTPQSTLGPSEASARQTVASPLSANDRLVFLQALASAKRGDVSGARGAIASLSDKVARKTATWALVDANAESLSFYEVDAARRDLAGFPRPARRQVAAQRLLESAGKSPSQVVDWFAGQPPQSAYGAISLATAYRSLGRGPEAADLIKTWWRTKSFEADAQRSMLGRFGDVLTVDDHIRRADI